jgi:hypothetical protein
MKGDSFMRFVLFVGLFFILGGLSIFADVLFKVHLPLVRILLGLVLIYLGVSMLLRGFHVGQSWLLSDPQSIVFQHGVITPSADSAATNELNVLFSQAEVDLTAIPPPAKDREIKLNVVFGNARVRFDPRLPLKVIASAAFAGCRLPAGDQVVFGEQTYRSEGYREGAPAIILRLSVVFGAAELRRSEEATAAFFGRAERGSSSSHPAVEQ